MVLSDKSVMENTPEVIPRKWMLDIQISIMKNITFFDPPNSIGKEMVQKLEAERASLEH